MEARPQQAGAGQNSHALHRSIPTALVLLCSHSSPLLQWLDLSPTLESRATSPWPKLLPWSQRARCSVLQRGSPSAQPRGPGTPPNSARCSKTTHQSVEGMLHSTKSAASHVQLPTHLQQRDLDLKRSCASFTGSTILTLTLTWS